MIIDHAIQHMSIARIPLVFFTLCISPLLSYAQTKVFDASSTGPLPIAVFDFQAGDRAIEKKGAEVGILLNALLSGKPELFLVERQEVEKLLGEQEFGLTGTMSSDTAAKVGALVGAKILITGRIFETGGKAYFVAKIMGTETGRVFGEMTTSANLEKLDEPVTLLAEKITATIASQAPVLVTKVETSEARIARLKKIVAGKKLPAVQVLITEQHLARPVIDPAAQTELAKTLAEVGFEVIDAAGAVERSDYVTISGDAFSEFGMRRGNLVSCRARIEVTVKDASGKLLSTDRQMDVAMDIAEHSAGKKALESAALKIVDRIIPNLVPKSP